MRRSGVWGQTVAVSLVMVLGLPLAGVANEPLHSDPVIQTTDRLLQARLEEIHRRSPLWREALEQLRGTRRKVFVVTPDKVVVKDRLDSPAGEPFDRSVLAAVAPVPGPDNRLDAVLVVVNLPLLQAMYLEGTAPPSGLHGDLDRILVHEVYGHALPYLLAGDLSGRCPDPGPRERATLACAVRRENAVREELRLGQRHGYGLEGLVLMRSTR